MKIKVSDFIYDDASFYKINIARDLVSLNQNISMSIASVNNDTNLFKYSKNIFENNNFSAIEESIKILPNDKKDTYIESIKTEIISIYNFLNGWLKDIHGEIEKSCTLLRNSRYNTRILENKITSQLNDIYYVYTIMSEKYYDDSMPSASAKIVSACNMLDVFLYENDKQKQIGDRLFLFIKKLSNLCANITNTIEIDIIKRGYLV